MDAEYRVRERTRVTCELVAQTPLDWKNFGFVLARVQKDLREAGRIQYDDACEVSTGDNELIFTWLVSDVTT